MSVEFTSDMNYVYKYQKSVPQNETANIVPSSTFRRTVSDIVITFYAINPMYYTITKHPQSLNIPIIGAGSGALSNPSENLAAGICGIIPTVVKIPGPIQLDNRVQN